MWGRVLVSLELRGNQAKYRDNTATWLQVLVRTVRVVKELDGFYSKSVKLLIVSSAVSTVRVIKGWESKKCPTARQGMWVNQRAS